MHQVVEVIADYSQFNIIVGQRGVGRENPAFHPASTVFLRNMFDDDYIAITARQFGSISIDVTVFEAEPAALEAEWADVSEVSLATTDSVLVGGWQVDSSAARFTLDPARSYRLRYAVAGGDDIDDVSDDVTERYRVDIWPAPSAPAATVTQTSAWGRYFAVSYVTEGLAESRGYRSSADDAEAARLLTSVFERVPGLAREVIDDTEDARVAQIGSRFVPLGADHRPLASQQDVAAFVRDVARAFEGS